MEHFRNEQVNNRARKLLATLDSAKVHEAGLQRFDDYVASGPADLGYSFFIPLHDLTSDESGVSQAAEALLRQPQLNF